MQKSGEAFLKKALIRDTSISQSVANTAHAYLYRYLARIALTKGESQKAREFLSQAAVNDSSIFYRDFRSFLTLLCVYAGSPANTLVNRFMGQT